MENLNEILEKINDLRKLSTSSNVHEAATAAAIADKLISKYRISEAQLSSNGKEDLEIKEDSEVLYQTSRIIRWKQILARVLVRHYNCYMWNDTIWRGSKGGRRINRFRISGTESDIIIVHYMFNWLIYEIERLRDLNAKGMGHTYVFSYCEGAVAGIADQLEKMKKEIKELATQTGQSTALVKLDERAVLAKMLIHKKYNLKTVYDTTSRKIISSGFEQGRAAGRSINLTNKALKG